MLATFDMLTIAQHFRHRPLSVSRGEVHLFAYLACLMYIYKNKSQTANGWGYTFAATPSGAPFSVELDAELERLLRNGLITLQDDTLKLTGEGLAQQEWLRMLELNSIRIEFLEAATSSKLAIPSGVMRSAFASDQDAITATNLGKSRELFTPRSIPKLQEDFDALREVLGSSASDLLAASVLWLTYLDNESLTLGNR